jgi:hypothetical protein
VNVPDRHFIPRIISSSLQKAQARTKTLLVSCNKALQAKLAQALPAFVQEHDDVLEEQPLYDYGCMKSELSPELQLADASDKI